MARRAAAKPANQTDTSTTEPVQEDAVSTSTETVTEAPVETDAPVSESTESTEPTTTEGDEPEADFTAFNKAVETAVAEADRETGLIAPLHLEPVTQEYRKLAGLKAKNAAKATVAESLRTSMNESDINKARAFMNVTDALTAGSTSSGGGRKPATPADPTEAFVQLTSGLRLALTLASASVPEGVAEDWADKAKAKTEASVESAKAYLAWLTSDAEDKGDEPEADAFVKGAVKLSQGRSAKVGGSRASSGTSTPYTGERRDIAKHIANAFEDKASGDFLSIAEIRNAKSDEYGDTPPSAGAISARLFPKSGKSSIEGVTPATNDKGNKGATKN